MPLSEAVKLETAMALEYMEAHGTFNVRGGGLCQVEEKYLKRHLTSVTAVRHPIGFKEDV